MSRDENDHNASLLRVDPSASVQTEALPHAVRVRDGWRGLAAWMRAPGTINREDAIDECARAVQNYAEYQFKLATEPIPDDAEPRLNPVFEKAIALCRALSAYPMPSIQPESDGAIGLDWDEGQRRVLAITVYERPEVGYSYLAGEFQAHGRVKQASAVAMIEEVLRLIYPEIGSGTQAAPEHAATPHRSEAP